MMPPLELTPTTMKLQLTIDRQTVRNAACELTSTDGFMRLWKHATANCKLEDGEGLFTLEID